MRLHKPAQRLFCIREVSVQKFRYRYRYRPYLLQVLLTTPRLRHEGKRLVKMRVIATSTWNRILVSTYAGRYIASAIYIDACLYGHQTAGHYAADKKNVLSVRGFWPAHLFPPFPGLPRVGFLTEELLYFRECIIAWVVCCCRSCRHVSAGTCNDRLEKPYNTASRTVDVYQIPV